MEEIANMSQLNQKLVAAAYERLKKLKLTTCFDSNDLDSRPTEAQQEIFDFLDKVSFRWVIAGNQSGKTQLACREIAWIVNQDHPTWTKPEKWGDESLMIIVAGQDRKNMELNIWNKKIKPLLTGEWKETRVGGSIQYATNLKTKDQIVFMSHADSSERNRKYMQGYVAHYVWLDEMPGSIDILEELQRRVDARDGYFIGTFTPKVSNAAIRKVVDSAKEPTAKKFKMGKLDNPIYKDRIQAEIDKLDGYPEYKKRTILYGDWMPEDGTVFQIPDNTMIMPNNYSRLWRHVESVDPAVSTKMGYTLWAEDPTYGVWYCVKAEYIEGIYDPVKILEHCLSLSAGHNIVRRICDPHETWYLATAATKKVSPAYMTPFNKNNRKAELIKGLQEKLGNTLRISPTCDKLVMEFEDCRWSLKSDTPKIMNASKFHLLDSAQYFADLVPKFESTTEIGNTWYDQLRESNDKRIKLEKKEAEVKAKKAARGSIRISRNKKRKPNGARIINALLNYRK